jgi:hypothetical protein
LRGGCAAFGLTTVAKCPEQEVLFDQHHCLKTLKLLGRAV